MTDKAKNSGLDLKVQQAEIKALEARQKADEAAKGKASPEEVAAQKAAKELDDVRALMAEKEGHDSLAREGRTVVEAKVLAVVPPNTLVGEHLAQNFGNDPENPKTAPWVAKDGLVKLSRLTPDYMDGKEKVVCEVPEGMVGDYLRAGWNRD